jgi:cell division protein FtsA
MRDFYQSQRAMRNMRQAAMQRGVVAILDVGSSKIACLVLRFDGPEQFGDSDGVGSMAGQSSFRVIGAATTRSRGVRFGEVDAMAETERAIRTAVQAAQKMANVRVDHVIACLSGGRPRSYGLDGQVDVMGQTVTEGDIGRVLADCEVPDIGEGREVLHAQPINFALDHRSGLADPRGQIGSVLTTDMHLMTIEDSVIENLLYCIKRCDLELAGIASSAYAAGISSLVEDEQELGAACIDMGGGSTGISIFMRKHMIYSDCVRMGGDHVTSDISMGLQVAPAMAERIKTFYGGVFATGMDDREMIEEVRVRLDAAGFEHLPSQQIVLTGGGSQIPGLDGLATKILGQQVRLGRPLRVQGLPQAATGSAFSAAVGLSLFAAHPQDEWWDFDIPAEKYPARSFKRAVRWFRENW